MASFILLLYYLTDLSVIRCEVVKFIDSFSPEMPVRGCEYHQPSQ